MNSVVTIVMTVFLCALPFLAIGAVVYSAVTRRTDEPMPFTSAQDVFTAINPGDGGGGV